MKITFGLSLDGWEPLKSPQCLNEFTCGPAGFLELLEVRLGLKTNPVPLSQRLLHYKALLGELAEECVTFYSESFKKDPYAVAETLVGWRDGLIVAGWDGEASGKDSARLRDMSALEARTSGRLAPGMGDRLRTVLRELLTRSPCIDTLTVVDEPEHLPSLWRQVCEKLGAHYAPINAALMSNLATGDSDLARIQALVGLLGDQALPKINLKGDQSIICLTAFSEYTLARGVAQWLRHIRLKEKATVTLIPGANAGPLEQALLALDEPALGLEPYSRARPIPQILLLALRLYWKPLDPRSLLEFLTHPICPVSGSLRHRLANAVAESPGVGGPKWNEAIAAVKAGICEKQKGNVSAQKEALQQIDDELCAWLLVSQFEENEEATGIVLSERCAQVARWAAARAGVTGGASEEREQFLGLAALGSELADLLQQTSKVTRSQLERLLHQISDRGWPSGPAAELEHVHLVANPAAIREPASVVVWWDFNEPALPSRPPWTQQEMEQLTGHGVSFLTPEMTAARASQLGLRPLLAARQQLILVVPRQRGGNRVARHPLHARLISLIEGKNPSLPTIDLDAEVSTGKASAPLELRSVKHLPLPALMRWWKLSVTKHLGPRTQESYSSAEKFIYSPYAWVLNYKAGLQPGPIASLRLQDARRQKGTLLHRLVDLLLAAPPTEINWINTSREILEKWIEGQWLRLLAQEGADLLLPGKRADAVALKEMGKAALWELLQQLRKADATEAQSNVALPPAGFVGGQIGGIIDLQAKNRKGRLAVVDLKSGGRKVREQELKENRALQLAIYGYLLGQGNKGACPETAYYILQSRVLMAQDRGFFPDAYEITPAFAGGPTQCWKDFEAVWSWRRRQVDQGWIEVTVADTEPTSGSPPQPDSTPPLERWMAAEDADKFNDFDALTGWRADA